MKLAVSFLYFLISIIMKTMNKVLVGAFTVALGAVLTLSSAAAKGFARNADQQMEKIPNGVVLTITSDDIPEVDEIVTYWGVVAVDKDFGAGYTYELIVEEATRLKD